MCGTLFRKVCAIIKIFELITKKLFSHICGLMANHLNFRMERIIALDPARPLIRPGNQHRLDTGDARAVQVIYPTCGNSFIFIMFPYIELYYLLILRAHL